MALPPRQVIELVKAREVDLGVLYEPANEPGLHSVPLCEAEIICALPRAHHFEDRKNINAGDLREHKIISFAGQSYAGGLLQKNCAANGIPWTVAIEVNQAAAALSMVEAGIAVAVVDPFTVTNYRNRNIVLKPFRPRTVLHARAIYASGRRGTPLGREFIEALKEVAARHVERMPNFMRLTSKA